MAPTVTFSGLQEHGLSAALPSPELPACPGLFPAVASPFCVGPKLLMPGVALGKLSSFVSSALVALDCHKLVVDGHGDSSGG